MSIQDLLRGVILIMSEYHGMLERHSQSNGEKSLIAGSPVFIDAFAGCGGLSLGLMQAGWRGLFAIEKDKFAFETLASNLLNKKNRHFYDWPDWLEKKPHCMDDLFYEYGENLKKLDGQIDLLAGGPPCQGFSTAGKRKALDPRNSLMNSYFKLVEFINPKIVLIENVQGITVDFKKDDEALINYSEILINKLSESYVVHWGMLDASEFGVPQRRSRFFLIGVRKDMSEGLCNPFDIIKKSRKSFLDNRGLLGVVSSLEAISDLEVVRNGKTAYAGNSSYEAIAYKKPITSYQRMLRKNYRKPPTNTRLAKHRLDIVSRFAEIIKICQSEGRLNVSVGRDIRNIFGLKKQALRVLDPKKPSPTITSMPDDLLHYKEPRTLTVRENARLQSFPDWYDFKGKYTSGGLRRTQEVPRFTQVANAVPPLLAEAVGGGILKWISTRNEANLI